MSNGEQKLADATGKFVELLVGDVGTVERAEKAVKGKTRRAVEVEHTVDGASVETHVSGGSRTVSVLESFVRRGEQHDEVDVDLIRAKTRC